MKKNNLTKKLIIIAILIFSSIALFQIIPSTIAKTEIPIYDPPDHDWFWHDDVIEGTYLMYEEETTKAFMNGTVILKYKMLKIINITDIINTTRDGSWYYNSSYYGNASLILGTECYYNCTSDEYVSYNMTTLYGGEAPPEIPLSMFGYNDTSGFEHYGGMFRSIAPSFFH